MAPHGRATVDPRAPRAFGRCDRCGFLYNLVDLVFQYDWVGDKLMNLGFRVCRRTCVDKPYEGNRPLKLPPDPVPVNNPRPETYSVDEDAS